MLTILLINDNKIVSRLFQLSSQKHNYDLEENNQYNASKDAYNIVFVDSQIYDEDKFLELKSKINFDKSAYLGEKGKEKPKIFDLLLEKPFLPTDFVSLMQENFKVVQPDADLDTKEVDDEFDLDSLEEIKIDDELEDLEEMDLDSLADVDEESSPEIKEPAGEIDTKDEISDVLADIDDLDSGGEDELDSSILSEELVKEALDEVKDEEKILPDSAKAVAAASVGAAIVADSIDSDEKESQKDLDMVDELDSLDERMVKEAILGEKIIDTDDAKEDNLVASEANEEFIESSDLEAIIQKAVSKALNKEMLSKALEELEIVVSFRQKSS
jgi:uncharacterized membrane protein